LPISEGLKSNGPIIPVGQIVKTFKPAVEAFRISNAALAFDFP